MSFFGREGLRGGVMGYGLPVMGYGLGVRGGTNASEQITAAECRRKEQPHGKDECGGNTRRVIGEH